MGFIRLLCLTGLGLLAGACASVAPLDPDPARTLTLDPALTPDVVPTFANAEQVDAYALLQQQEREYADQQRRAYNAEQRRIREEERRKSDEERLALAASLGREARDLEAQAEERMERAAGLEGHARAAEIQLAEQDRARARTMRRRARRLSQPSVPQQTAYSLSTAVTVTGSRAVEDISITNTQEAGVDEGGLVKATGEFLVILRRGRVYVVRHEGSGGEQTLEAVSSIDAFPPGDDDPDDTWYDEMLLHQGMVVVIGYSYGEGGTEISRFNLSDTGQLSYRDTHYLSSSDYYSSSNYASRMIGGTFYTYTPTRFRAGWRDDLPFLERRNPDGSRQRIGETLVPTSMGIAAPLLIDPSPTADLMHGITTCDVLSAELECSTRTVLGTASSEYYFSREAAYIWTGTGHNSRWGRASRDWGSLLYRIPFETSDDITAISVQGAPVDQFSFLEDDETGSLFVMTVGDFIFENSGDFGLQMWESEWAEGDAALLQIPLDEMGNGAVQLPRQLYRALPDTNGRVQNRYVGRSLMYGSGEWGYDDEPTELFITPLDQQWVQRIEIPHAVSRLDRLGNDGVVIGRGQDGALGFSAIEFSVELAGELIGARRTASLASTYMLPAAKEGESRSQAFFWRGDADDPDSGDGLMALPVNKAIEEYDFYYLGSSSAIFYLRREDGELYPMGELDPNAGAGLDENAIAAAQEMEALDEAGQCQASCTDWYGNSRPIFIGDRIFALMGDEILEGDLAGGRITEERRVNFAR